MEPGQHLLDIGCGTGGPAIALARGSGGSVTGITVSHSQVTQAAERARAAGMSDRVDFRYGDVNSLEFADESFDAAMAIDSFAHLLDQRRAFGEVSRVLRPGARFMLSQFTQRGAAPRELIASFTEIWCTPPPLQFTDAVSLPLATGFEVLRIEDMTQNCVMTSEVMSVQFVDNYDRIAQRYGTDAVAAMTKEIPRFRQYTHDHLSYHLFLLRKPR
ncbi:class I SAM-dependent methyltransferase [Nocardia terpenica]|uniref:class I SAM-dependent methyltransferase n=1 Tax=Nocardia terpenica TaxID=455432 RepID=UPI001EEB076C|nr:class I SAM-dependent methyltransferase [Nocardia terpenica]